MLHKKSTGRWALVALAASLLLGGPLSAGRPAPETQALRGEVADQKNAPIAGAVCTLLGPALPTEGRPVTTDESGKFEFTGLLPGKYALTCTAVGYEPVAKKDLEVSEGETPFVQMVLPAEVVLKQKVEVSAQAAKVSAQPTAPPAALEAPELLSLPLAEQKFLAALPVLPGVVRTPDGRLSIKGALENVGLLLVDSAETVDPVTGSFSIQVPIDAVESVEVQKTAYQAQFGRFSGGLTSVQTKAPLNQWHWELNDFLPSPRLRSGHWVGMEDDSPRAFLTGPLWKDKLNFIESFMYDFNRQPVRGLPWPHNETKKEGAESFTDVDYVLSDQHLLTANLKLFPMRQQYANISSLVPQSASSDYAQSGYSLGATDRFIFTSGAVLTTLFQQTHFSSYSHGQGAADMLLTPNGWGGNFFNVWTRESGQQEFLQTFQFPRVEWHGQQDLKTGGDFVHRAYDGSSISHPVQLLRSDGTLAEQIDFSAPASLAAEDTELAFFAQDHWAFNDHFAADCGARFSGQTIGDRATLAPRLGLMYSPGQHGKTILRSGVGLFYDRVPLLAADFTENPDRIVTQYNTSGNPTGPPVVFRNAYEKIGKNGVVIPTGHRLDSTPYNLTWSFEVDQELRPNVIARLSYLGSRTYDVFIINPLSQLPIPELLLDNTGGSRYQEFESTIRVRARGRVDLNISYVYSLTRGDLNTLAAVFVPFEEPVIRPNFFGTLPANVPNRLVTWGRFKIPWKITASPLVDVHSGFPYSAVDALQNYVGTPDSRRFPTFASIDLQLSKDFHLLWVPWAKRHMFRGSARIFNITNHGNFRDVYNNVTSPFYRDLAGFQHRSYDVALDVLY